MTQNELVTEQLISAVAKILTDGSIRFDELREVVEWKYQAMLTAPTFRGVVTQAEGIWFMVENQNELYGEVNN